MAAEANIEASRRAIEDAFGDGRLEVLDEICADDLIGHDPLIRSDARAQAGLWGLAALTRRWGPGLSGGG